MSHTENQRDARQDAWELEPLQDLSRGCKGSEGQEASQLLGNRLEAGGPSPQQLPPSSPARGEGELRSGPRHSQRVGDIIKMPEVRR